MNNSWPRALFVIGTFCLSGLTMTARAGPYSLLISQRVSHESNVLRAETTQSVPEGLSREDTVSTSLLQGGFDEQIGRQRVFGQASVQRTQFARNSVYDNTGHELNAGLDWATVQRLSGSLSLGLVRNLAQFSNDETGILNRSNIERTRRAQAGLRWGMSARITAEAALTWRSVDFTAPEFASRDFNETIVYIGGRQELSGAAWWSTGLRQSSGRYPRFRTLAGSGFEADQFDRHEIEWRAALKPNGASDLELRLGVGRTSYDRATSRDVSGLFGSLDWTWRPTGRLQMKLHAARDPSQDSYFVNTLFGRGTLSYDRMATSLQLRTDLTVSAKTTLSVTAGFTDRSLARGIEVSDITLPALRADDRTYQYLVALRWQAARSLSFGFDLGGERRRQVTALSRPYQSTTLSAFGQLSLD